MHSSRYCFDLGGDVLMQEEQHSKMLILQLVWLAPLSAVATKQFKVLLICYSGNLFGK